MSIYLKNLNNEISVNFVRGGMVFYSGSSSIDLTCKKVSGGYEVNFWFSPGAYETVNYKTAEELTEGLSDHVNDIFAAINRKVA